MNKPQDWETATFEGNRLRQQREFAKLSFREQLECVEAMGELARRLGPATERPPADTPVGGDHDARSAAG
jgi:hypothetical protein